MKKIVSLFLGISLIISLCACGTGETFNTYQDLSDQKLEEILAPLNEIESVFLNSQNEIQNEIYTATKEISDYSDPFSQKRMSDAYDFVADNVTSTFDTVGQLSVEYFSLVFEYTDASSDTRDTLIGQYLSQVETDLIGDYDTFLAAQSQKFNDEFEGDYSRKYLSRDEYMAVQLKSLAGFKKVVLALKDGKEDIVGLDSVAVLGIDESDSTTIKNILENTWETLR